MPLHYICTAMSIRICNVRLELDEAEASLPERLAHILKLPTDSIQQWRILRKSLDARVKDDFHFICTAEVSGLADEVRIVELAQKKAAGAVRVDQHDESLFQMPPPGPTSLEHRPVVVGTGPAGLVAGYFLAEQGYRPLLLERGRAVTERIHDVRAFDGGGPFNPESNYLFGEGGAGTFSDGKLTCRNSGPEVRRVLELFAECKGKPSVVYEHRPHLGSNRLPAVVKAIRRAIEAMGGEIRFSCRVEDIDIGDGRLRGLATSSGFIPANVALFAIGHSARDTINMLFTRGVPMVARPFQMGVRIEQPQETVNRVQYGPAPLEDKLGAADYTLVARGPHDLFTFCMCAGGYVMPSVSEPGFFCTNGMSLSRRDSPFANSGLVVTVPLSEFPGDDVLAGIRLQQRYEGKAFALGGEDYLCPIQWAKDFLDGRLTRDQPPSSYPRGLALAEIAELVPPFIVDILQRGLPILNRRWQGRFLREATLVGPEARGSCPIRMLRDEHSRDSPAIAGFYPVGEGAGYAGGIVSAAVDGLRSAMAVVSRFARLT